MTTAQALLKNIQDQDVEVTVVGSKLRIGGLEEVLTEALCVLLCEQKAELIAQLSGTTSNHEETASDECPSPVGDNRQGQLSTHHASHDLFPLASALNGDNQKEPEREWSEEELALLEELDELLEGDSMPFDWGFPWQEIDDSFPAELWLDTTSCCGQPPSEGIDDLLALLEPELPTQLWSVCSQCGAEAWYYDGDGEGFCGNDCYQAYHQQCQASSELACVTQEEDIVPIGQQLPQAARKTPSSFFSLRNTAKRYQLHVTKQQRNWFMGLSTRSMQWTTPFPGKQLVYMVQNINLPHRIACKHWLHLCRPPNQQQLLTRPMLAREVEDIRCCCIAPEGSCVLTADLSNTELHILAKVLGDATMVHLFVQSEDMDRYNCTKP